MKNVLYSLFLALTIMSLAACSNDDNNDPQLKKGMTLYATIEDMGTRATMTDNDGSWKFAFTTNDVVNVSNEQITSYYTFTNMGNQFASTDAMTTAKTTHWYAYFPGNEVDLTKQKGTFDDVANKYAVAGKTNETTTGADGLSIALSAKVAVLRVVEVDKTGTLDINVKTADGKWVKGLTAIKNEDNFAISTNETKTTLLSKTSTAGEISYVVVPAGQKIAIYNGNLLLNTTKEGGLTAGKYYTITSGPTKGTAKALINNTETPIEWVQLWAGGPRFATKDVAKAMTWTDAAKTGSDFAWGENWRAPTDEEITKAGGFSYDWENQKTTTGSPTITLSQKNGEDILIFTGVQLGYTKNSLTLYNKIDKEGNSNFGFWTSSEGNNYGHHFNIKIQNGIIVGFGIWQVEDKTKYHLVRPVLAKSPW